MRCIGSRAILTGAPRVARAGAGRVEATDTDAATANDAARLLALIAATRPTRPSVELRVAATRRAEVRLPPPMRARSRARSDDPVRHAASERHPQREVRAPDLTCSF